MNSAIITPESHLNIPDSVKNRQRRSMADLLHELGGISAERNRLDPAPGTANELNASGVNERECYCELMDGTLVELSFRSRQGYFSTLACIHLMNHFKVEKPGVITQTELVRKRPDYYESGYKLHRLFDFVSEHVTVLDNSNGGRTQSPKKKLDCRIAFPGFPLELPEIMTEHHRLLGPVCDCTIVET